MSSEAVFDAIIVGGGPAGLSAAAWLGRYRRRILLLDAGDPRNEPTWAVHGFPGLPEVPPLTLRRRLRQQASDAGAELRAGMVVGLEGDKGAFEARTGEGESIRARRVLLCYGRKDVVPEIDGIDRAYGTSVFHCPDCDGPTVAERRVAVLGGDPPAAALALFLTPWAARVTLLPRPEDPPLTADLAERLRRHDVAVVPGHVVRLDSRQGQLRTIRFEDGRELGADALFFHLGTFPACDLAAAMQCDCDAGSHVRVDHGQETSVPGVYAAGDLTGHPYLAVTAAAEGVRAALAMHRSLLPAGLEIGHVS